MTNIFERRIEPTHGVEFHGRVSSDESDPGHQNFLDTCGHTILVMLDGVEQKDCDMADPIAGVVRRCKYNSHGEIYAIGDEIAQETVKGHVQVFLKT